MTVPQVGHLPLMALRPFFMVSSTASEISFLALHLTQYPSGINDPVHWALTARSVMGDTLRAGCRERQLGKRKGQKRRQNDAFEANPRLTDPPHLHTVSPCDWHLCTSKPAGRR